MGIRLGGQAANDGVTFYSDNYKASFVMKKDGTYKISHSKLVQIEGLRAVLTKIPIVKGFVVLFERPTIAVMILLFVAVDLFGPSGILSPAIGERNQAITTFVLMAALLLITGYIIKKTFIKARQTWKFHGAEHKVVYATVNDVPLELKSVRKCPRIAERCGTNLLMFLFTFKIILRIFIPYPSIVVILAFVLAYELFDLENGSELPIIKYFFKAGYWCQEKLFTREPTDEQLLAAIDTAEVLIKLEEGDANATR